MLEILFGDHIIVSIYRRSRIALPRPHLLRQGEFVI